MCSGYSGWAQEWSPSAQVKAAAAHVQTLKRNQQKNKLSLTYRVASGPPGLADDVRAIVAGMAKTKDVKLYEEFFAW